jgi:methylated-DNA-[protein]-cysteine S-methyltransferase
VIQTDDRSLRASWLSREIQTLLRQSREDRSLLPDLIDRLSRYFDGDADIDFSDIPLPTGGEFHRRCWKACRRIPRGQACTYGDLAAMAGSPAASRAAGQAMRTNFLPIIVPCHRVIGSNGLLHGFGGTTNRRSKALEVKRRLLEMEGALADDGRPRLVATSRRTAALAAA